MVPDAGATTPDLLLYDAGAFYAGLTDRAINRNVTQI